MTWRRRGAAQFGLGLLRRLTARLCAGAYRRACEALVDADPAQLSESGQRARREAIRARQARGRAART
jgi:hypothetical protein